MVFAVISDIHGNLEALKAVFGDIEHQEVSEVFCLGDSVGYGPEPEEVVTMLRRRNIPELMGNHELALLSASYYKKMNPSAQKSIDITRTLLSRETLEYMEDLPAFSVWHGARCVHGSPPDSITRYLFDPSTNDLEKLFRQFPEPLCFYGHTHNLGIYELASSGETQKRIPGEEEVSLNKDSRYLINIGSVGQPRDGSNRAKYVIWDREKSRLEVRFVSYDIKKTADRIMDLGFPEFNALRLW